MEPAPGSHPKPETFFAMLKSVRSKRNPIGYNPGKLWIDRYA